VQGREFFASARQAADLVRPLLLYYGVLALSRGLVLFLDTTKSREAALNSAHGCEAVDWQHDLAIGIRGLPNLKVRFRDGTFSELTRATGNVETVNVSTTQTGLSTPLVGRQDGSAELISGTTLTVKEVLAHIPELQSLYERTFGEYSSCYPARVFVQSQDSHTDVLVLETSLGLPSEQQIRETFKLPAELSMQPKNRHSYAGEVRHLAFRLHHSSFEELDNQLPPVKNDRSRGSTFLVAPLSNGERLSSLSFL
jgi:hypothetical protein